MALNTKKILENLVLTHDVTEAVSWVYNNLNFIAQQIGVTKHVQLTVCL